jgi:hypothetical protein
LRDRLIFLSLVFWRCNAVSSMRVCCAENTTLTHGVFSESELLVPHLCIILILICINYSCYWLVWLISLWI